MSIGMRVEEIALYGLGAGNSLSPEERAQIVAFGLGFEECCYTAGELEAMVDLDLVRSVYFIMADYARGQM